MKNNFLLIVTTFLFYCCNDRNISEDKKRDFKISPFEFKLIDYNYSLAYSVEYILTEKELMILNHDEVISDGKIEIEEKKNNVVLDTLLTPSEDLEKLSRVNIDSLKEYYENPCIADGTQISAIVTKGKKTKKVHLSNYHHPDIGQAIETINNIVPEKFKITYDKKSLIEHMERCK